MQRAYHFKYSTLNRGMCNIFTVISSSMERAEELFAIWNDRYPFPDDAYLCFEEVYETEVSDTYQFIFTTADKRRVAVDSRNFYNACLRLNIPECIDVEVS